MIKGSPHVSTALAKNCKPKAQAQALAPAAPTNRALAGRLPARAIGSPNSCKPAGIARRGTLAANPLIGFSGHLAFITSSVNSQI